MIVKMQPHVKFPHQIWLVYFENGGASANIAWLEDRRDRAYLYDMFSKNRHQGEASTLLQEIHQYCLDNEVLLIIRAKVFEVGSDGIPNNELLKEWYIKNGATFVNDGKRKQGPLLLMGDLSKRP